MINNKNLTDDYFKYSGIYSGKNFLKRKDLLGKPNNKIGEPVCVLFTKKIFEKVGGFNCYLLQILDVEFWYKCFRKTDLYFEKQDLVSFRLHNEQATSNNSKTKVLDSYLFPLLLAKQHHFYLHYKVFFKAIYIGIGVLVARFFRSELKLFK